MSKADAKLRHEKFKRVVDRAAECAKTEFEKAQVEISDELGAWLHEVHNDACNGISLARECQNNLDTHIDQDKGWRRGVKWAIGIVAGAFVILSGVLGLLTLFCK